LSSNVKREFKKLYIAYKLDTNFVDVTQDLYNEREALIAAWNDEQV